MDWKHSMAEEVQRAAPPVTVGALTWAGIELADVVLWATLVYTVLQAYFLLRDKWWRQRERKD